VQEAEKVCPLLNPQTYDCLDYFLAEMEPIFVVVMVETEGIEVEVGIVVEVGNAVEMEDIGVDTVVVEVVESVCSEAHLLGVGIVVEVGCRMVLMELAADLVHVNCISVPNIPRDTLPGFLARTVARTGLSDWYKSEYIVCCVKLFLL
jgi:hypothetical protein